MTIIGLFDGIAIVEMTGRRRRRRRCHRCRFHVELYLSCLFELEFTLCYLCAFQSLCPGILGKHASAFISDEASSFTSLFISLPPSVCVRLPPSLLFDFPQQDATFFQELFEGIL